MTLVGTAVSRALGAYQYPRDPLDNKTQVIIFNGQSNCFGLGTNAAGVGLTSVPSILYTYNHSLLSNPPVYRTEGRIPAAARTQYISTSYPIGSWGPALATANYLAANSNRKWEIGDFAIDGMSLAQNLLNSAWPLGGPPLLQQVKNFITNTLSACNGELNTYTLVHGEADAATTDNVAYAANLILLFDELTAAFGNKFRFILHRLSNKYSGNISNTIRAAQEALQNYSPRVRVTYGDKYALRDFAHYTDVGYRDLGYQIGSVILESAPPARRWWGAGLVSSKTSTGSLTPGVPTSGKLGLLAIAGIGNTAYVPPAGWTHVASAHDNAFAVSARVQLYWKWLAPGDTVTIADLPADDAASAVVAVFEGMSQSSPIDASATAVNTTASTSLSIPSALATGDGLAVAVISAEADSNNAQVVVGNGWEEHVNFASTNASGTNLAIAVKPVSAGNTGAETWSLVSSSTAATVVAVLR